MIRKLLTLGITTVALAGCANAPTLTPVQAPATTASFATKNYSVPSFNFTSIANGNTNGNWNVGSGNGNGAGNGNGSVGLFNGVANGIGNGNFSPAATFSFGSLYPV